ncbi:hypothetical protein [Aquabacterium sp.]|uniref:hypothetical protein n=1 Tax=Aquabacterium sp. TaxID=1872578 RepID=UPI0019870326|nr:hypothetical protein [Aquabacterium sp.]MBC7702155.1 hypothetical protein [Aquabacterium sp.]
MGAVCSSRLSPYQALLAAVLSAIGMTQVWAMLLATGFWFAPTAYMLTALLAYPFWSWRRLEITTEFLDAEILRLAATTTIPAEASLDQHIPRDQVERHIATIQGANVHLQQAQ